jgi:DNA-binding transcriptional LysR family regulator
VQFTFTELQVLAGLAAGRTVVDIGNHLSLGHSAISRAVHVAQQRAGVQLVEHEGRRLRLTPAGHDLAVRAASAVHEVEEVSRFADAQRTGTSGVVRILASATPADYLLPAVIAEFLTGAPAASVVLRNSMAEDEPLERFDLRIGPPEPVPPGWRAEVLYVDELLFFVSARNPLAQQAQLTWSDIQSRSVVGQFIEPYWPRYWVGLSDPPRLPSSTVDVSSTESVKRLVDSMDVVGLAVRTALREGLESGQFVALPSIEQRIELPYVLEYRAVARLLPVVDRFRRVLIDHIARL